MIGSPDNAPIREGRHWPFALHQYQWRTYKIQGKSQLWKYTTATRWQAVPITEIGVPMFFVIAGMQNR